MTNLNKHGNVMKIKKIISLIFHAFHVSVLIVDQGQDWYTSSKNLEVN